MGDDELRILIEASFDEAKSLQNILADLKQLQNKVKTYRLKVLAGLDKTASAAQIKSDLAQITKTKSKVKIVGEVDKSTTRKNVDTAIKNLKNAEIKLTGVLDSTTTQRNVQQQLGQIPKVETTANVNVNGGDEVDKLRSQMDNAKTSAAGMAAQLYVARSALQLLRRTAVEAKEIIIDLDSAATDLALATGANSEEAYKLLEQYNALGKRLGATTVQVAEGATEWLRQGKSAAETSALIEQSMILSKVGAMSADESTKNLTSTMKGFKLEVEDVAGVVDRLTALDLKAAVTSANLATAVARTASSANLAGVGLDKLLGYVTVVEETTQKSAETIGESFKTIFSRMGNVKLGKFLDDDGEDLSDTEKILSSFGIALRENNEQFRDFGVVLDEIASRWSDFTNVEQSAIATTIAGTRQRENFLVLMENYGAAIEYAGVAADSAGTAMEKFAAYEDSIEAKAASFVAAMESLTMDTIDSGLVKDLISASTALIEFTEKAGLLKATLLSLGAGATIKGVQMIAAGFKNVSQHVLNMGEAVNILRRVGDVSALSGEQIKRLGTLTKGLSDSQLKLVLSSQNLSAAQMQAILQASGLTSAEAAQKLQTLGLAAAQHTTTGATWSLSAAMNGLKVAIMSNPIGALMTAISAATVVLSLFANAWEEAKQKAEEARQAMDDAAKATNDQRVSLDNLVSEYKELASAGDFDASSRDAAKRIQQEITDLVGEQADNLDLVNGKLDDQIAKLDEIRLANAKEAQNTLDTKYRDAKSKYEAGRYVDDAWFRELGSGKEIFETSAILKYIGYNNEAWKDSDGVQSLKHALDKASNTDEVLKIFKEYQDLLLNNDGWEDIVGGNGQDYLNRVQAQIDLFEGIIKEYQSAQKNFLENEAVIGLGELKTPGVDAEEALSAYVQAIKDSTEYSEAEKRVLLDLANNAFPEVGEAAREAANSVDLPLGTAQTEKLTDVLSNLKSTYDLLETAKADMANGGGLSSETIKKLADAEANYLDYLYEENGVVKLNTKAWEENANSKTLGKLDGIQSEIDALEQQNAALMANLEIYRQNKHASAGNTALTEEWDREIQEITAAIDENNRSIEENQNELEVWRAAINGVKNASSGLIVTLSNLSAISGNADKLSNALGAFMENGPVSADVLSGLAGVFGSLDSFEAFVDIMGDSASSMEDAQNACGKLMSEYIDMCGILDDVNDETAKVIERELEGMGVTNAHELVQARLNATKLEGVLASKNLSDATWETAEQILKESGASETAIASLKRLRQEQYNAKLAAVDFVDANSDVITGLIGQAKAAGVAAESIHALSMIQMIKNSLGNANLPDNVREIYQEQIEHWREKAQADLSDFGSITLPQVKVSLPKSSSKSGGSSSAKEVEEYRAELDALYEKLQAIQQIEDDIDRENAKADLLDDNDFDARIEHHRSLIQMYEKEQTALHVLAESRRELIRANLQTLSARGIEYDYDAANNTILIRNMGRINELSAATKGTYGTLQEATNALRKETEDLIGTTIDMVEANRENSDSWWKLQSSVKSARSDIVDTLIAMTDAASDAVDSIQNVERVLSDAAQEFADNDGWISIDTFQAIRDLGTEYMQMLVNENNELVINRERINGIIEAKTRQLAVEQALSYVERLRLAATGTSNESLDQLCFATTQATNSTWGLVYAELALMQQTGLLNGSQYQAALHNIQAIQSLAETAVAGIGQTAGAAAEKMDKLKKQLEDQKDSLEDLLDDLEDMKDGCDDLVQYVMDMLKDRIQQQIGALNDAKKAVKDYVDQLKEAMRAEKENAEYEDELADKLKAIAKLQAKIDALSLDDSRKAQAEKMALEEELAGLQKDLADFQADHAMDVTEETLDKQYEAYEQEKDAEIEKLEESISSTQKLYDMAIKYIKENWNTLYQELIDWNYEYGNNLNSEITAAWEAAQEAASRYGDFVTAIMGGIENDIAKITAQIQALTAQISNLSTSTSGANGIGSMPNVVGKVDGDTSYNDDDMK